jgi:hypothetical protein
MGTKAKQPNRAECIRRAVKIFKLPNGTVQQKMAFLETKGMSFIDILEAINQASGGELVYVALGGDTSN